MGLEVATTIATLVATNPTSSDPKSQGDDHLRMIKSVLQADAPALSATNTFTAVQNWAKGADIASASTINLTTATGNLVHVTGTTTITAVTLAKGPRTVIFDGVLTLTHHATNNNLPGGVSITTAAGDRAVYWSDGTTVYCVSYVQASQWVDYTPTLSATVNSGSLTPGTRNGSYRIDGDHVTFEFDCTLTTNSTASGVFQISLPFASTSTGTIQLFSGSWRDNVNGSNGTCIVGTAGATVVQLVTSANGYAGAAGSRYVGRIVYRK